MWLVDLPEERVRQEFVCTRVRTVADRLDPHFAAFALNGPIGRQQIDAMSRQIIGQANINSQEIRQLRLPLPPLAIQQALVAAISAARAAATRERTAAAHLATRAATELESALLGTRAQLPSPDLVHRIEPQS